MEKLTVYDIRCVDVRISNILNLLCKGPQCVGAQQQALP